MSVSHNAQHNHLYICIIADGLHSLLESSQWFAAIMTWIHRTTSAATAAAAAAAAAVSCGYEEWCYSILSERLDALS